MQLTVVGGEGAIGEADTTFSPRPLARRFPKDDRPRKAIEALRAWTRGEIRVGEARAAGVAAHAAAREADEGATRAAARAAGQAVGTAHMAGHACHAAAYAVTPVKYAAAPKDAAGAAAKEHDWQYQHLPEHLRRVVFSARDNI